LGFESLYPSHANKKPVLRLCSTGFCMLVGLIITFYNSALPVNASAALGKTMQAVFLALRLPPHYCNSLSALTHNSYPLTLN